MTLSEAQKGLLVVGDILLAIGFFFTIFGHVHRSEHKSERHFHDTLKRGGLFAVIGLLLLLSGVASKKKDVRKDISIQNIVLTVFTVLLYVWGVFYSKDPIVVLSISTGLAIGVGIMFNTIMLKDDTVYIVVENSPDATRD
jgi:hypothetical protein